jgi:hypothetical protein
MTSMRTLPINILGEFLGTLLWELVIQPALEIVFAGIGRGIKFLMGWPLRDLDESDMVVGLAAFGICGLTAATLWAI